MKLCIAYAPGGMKMLARMGRPHEYVAQIFRKGDGDAADEILKAVNAHEQLVEALDAQEKLYCVGLFNAPDGEIDRVTDLRRKALAAARS